MSLSHPLFMLLAALPCPRKEMSAAFDFFGVFVAPTKGLDVNFAGAKLEIGIRICLPHKNVEGKSKNQEVFTLWGIFFAELVKCEVSARPLSRAMGPPYAQNILLEVSTYTHGVLSGVSGSELVRAW